MRRCVWQVSLTALLIFCASAIAEAQDYWRVVKDTQIKEMNTFERAQYLKALKLLNERQYRAAASEFERFLIQFRDSQNSIPYMIFMRAYSLHLAKDRNKAISVYNEVLDFYPDVIDAAAPALYYRGMAYFDNGDYAKGMQSMKELVDDEDYRTEPVAANASIRLVENHWKNKEFDRASRYLQQINRDFRETAPQSANNARNLYGAYCLSTGKGQDYARWYLDAYRAEAEKEKKSPAEQQVAMVQSLYDILMRSWWTYFQNDMLRKYRGGTRGVDPAAELWKVMKEYRNAYMNAKKEWTYYISALRLLAGRGNIIKASEFEKLVQEAISCIAKTPDDDKNKDRQQNRYKEMTNLLIDGNRLLDATVANSRISDKQTVAWNGYRILEKQEKWNDAIKHLETSSDAFKSDAAFVKKCNWAKASILKDRLKKYDDAIKLYREISEPPGTLWAIAECQQRKGDLSSALKTLIEVENAFPNDGPEAAWRRAQYQEWAKNSEMAIKEARYILKKYPRSSQSSAAHQMLERYGIDTGGAVAD